MGFLDNIKSYFSSYEEEAEEEITEEESAEKTDKKVFRQEENTRRQESTPRIVNSKKTAPVPRPQMQVVLVKPDRFDDLQGIADHINDKKTVILNLEAADRDLARRMVDFLSGVTYANHGTFKPVSKGTFAITPEGVDMMGEVALDEFEIGQMYY